MRRSGGHIGWALVVGLVAAGLALISESIAVGLAGDRGDRAVPGLSTGGPVDRKHRGCVARAGTAAAQPIGPAKEYHWPQSQITSVYQRIAIWMFAFDERPVLGWGLDAACRIPGGRNGTKAESLDIHDQVMHQQVTKCFTMPPYKSWVEAGVVMVITTSVFSLFAILAHEPSMAGASARNGGRARLRGCSVDDCWAPLWNLADLVARNAVVRSRAHGGGCPCRAQPVL